MVFIAFDEEMEEVARSIKYRPSSTIIRRAPKILAWTDFFGDDLAGMMEAQAKACPVRCDYLRRGNISAEEADAVVFHIRDANRSNLPRPRSASQVYVAFLKESPYHTELGMDGQEKLPVDFFNAVLDYRIDPRTYFWGYGRMKKAQSEEEMKRRELLSEAEIEQIIDRKANVALMMISNCRTHSMREAYLRELARHMNITIVGPCLPNLAQATYVNCPRSLKQRECEKKLIDSHSFFFAFENSVCKDYVTEKFWRMKQNIVPIVLRRRLAEAVAPSSSFVAADDFDSPRELAHFLTATATNRIKYRAYFDWRNEYISQGTEDSGICQLCRDLVYINVSIRPNLDLEKYYSTAECEPEFGEVLLKNSLREH